MKSEKKESETNIIEDAFTFRTSTALIYVRMIFLFRSIHFNLSDKILTEEFNDNI